MQAVFANGRKNRSRVLALAIASMTAGVFFHDASGQTLTWDASGANASAATDGSGNWNTSTNANWSDGATNSFWVNGDVASIGNGGAAGIITIDDPSGVSAQGINFNPVSSGAYSVVASGPSTLTLTGPASISLGSGVSAGISASIAGSAGLAVGGAGILTVSGSNTFSGGVQINSGTLVVDTGGNLGASGNSLSLGTPTSGTSSGNPVGALSLASGATVNVGSFKNASNNAAAGSTLTINSGATLNVNGNLDGSGVNAAFVVGNANRDAAINTTLTVTGGGALNVTGGASNSSFLVGLGNANATSGNIMTANLDMSGLSNFSFVTGTSAGVGNEFAISHGTNVMGTATLAVNNSITAGTITVSDSSSTPGLTPAGVGATNTGGILNLGTGSNVLSCNALNIGAGRPQGVLQWAASGAGSLLVTGAAGGSSTANVLIGNLTSTNSASSASQLNLAGHTVTFQGGTVTVGYMNGATGGSSTTKGGSITFDTGVFNIQNLQLAVAVLGTGGQIAGTFNLGSNGNSTGVLNITNSCILAKNDDTSTTPAGSKGTFNLKGGTANIFCNMIDTSTQTSGGISTTVALSGGTLNMNGFAIGPKVAAGNSGAVGTRNFTSIAFSGGGAVLANLGGTGINDLGLNLNTTTNPSASTLILEGSNGYIGGTIAGNGTLQVGQPGDIAALTLPLGSSAGNVGVTANLSFASSNSVTVPNVIGGAGAIIQAGTGSTTLAANNTYAGTTFVNAGTLRAASIINGGLNSSIGSGGSSASKVVLSGGTLQYIGAGASTDRLFTVTATGGAIDASGSGALIFNNAGSVVSADPAARSTTLSLTSTKLTLPTVADLVVGMTVSGTGTNIPPGTTIISINPNANSVTLSGTPTFAGADTVSFSTANRNLTLTGTNVGANTLGPALANSAGGGTLGVTKSGTGAWRLTGSNSYTGVTTVQAGTLTAAGPGAWSPALANSNITGGRLVFDYNGGASPGTDVKNALASSFASGFSSGPIRSTAANSSKGLGWADDSGAKTVTVMLTYFGDANLDGVVNSGDFGVLATNYNSAGEWATGDFNYDGTVNALDFNALASNYGSQLASPALGALVPEPTCGLLFLLSTMPLRKRRKELSSK